MEMAKSFVGVIVAGVFLLAFGFANANGAELDTTLTTAVVTTALTGGIAFDAGQAVARRGTRNSERGTPHTPASDAEFDRIIGE